MEFTCIKCDFKFPPSQMDTDERMCYSCLEEEDIYTMIIAIVKKCNIHDLRTIYESLIEMGFTDE